MTAVADVADKYQALGLRTIPDCVAGAGPIGGVLTAVEDCADQRWLLVASCDLVGVDCNWVDLLMAGRREAPAVRADLRQGLPPPDQPAPDNPVY